MGPEEPERRRDPIVVRDDRSPFSAGDVFRRVETEARRLAQLARPDPIPLAFDAVGAVLDEDQAVPIGYGAQSSHVAHVSVQVNGDDRLDFEPRLPVDEPSPAIHSTAPLPDELLYPVGVDVPR